jgi:hypothetical protein
MRFDVLGCGSRRINGVRNFRQALASPHPAVRFTSRRGLFVEVPMMNTLTRFVVVAALAAVTTGCALSLRNPDIADLQRHPGRYQDHTVTVNGVVTSSWGLPLVPFRFYKVDDGTGEVTVLSEGSRMPTKGERVRVRGRVEHVAQLGGRALGLHLRERDLYVKR